MNIIQINVPTTKEDYVNGNGEGVWVRVDEETAEAYNNDSESRGFVGILDNSCSEYPDLVAGSKILFEMRGKKRPVADFAFLSTQKRRTKLPRPIDRSKRSNRRCVNCIHYEKAEPRPFNINDPAAKLCKEAAGGPKKVDYWNCCKNFQWNPNKPYRED